MSILTGTQRVWFRLVQNGIRAYPHLNVRTKSWYGILKQWNGSIRKNAPSSTSIWIRYSGASLMWRSCCFSTWNKTHKAPVSKRVTIKRNPFEMSGFALFCRMRETQRSAEWRGISVTKPLAACYQSKDR